MVESAATDLSTQAFTLRGVAIMDPTDGRPLADVTISAPKFSISRTTDALGQFALPLPGASPGEVVLLEAARPGFTVVEPSQLEVILPNPDCAPPTTILLAPEALLDEIAQLYFSDVCGRSVRKTRTEIELGAGSTPVEHETPDQTTAYRAKDNLARLFARENPNLRTRLRARAIAAFVAGKAGEALEWLGTGTCDASAARQDEVPDRVDRHLLKARILVTQLQFEPARIEQQQARDLAPDSSSVWYESALVDQALHRHEESRKAFIAALRLARASRDRPMIAAILEGLGYLEDELDRSNDARRAWREALEIHRKLASGSPDIHLARCASLLNAIGNCDLRRGIPNSATAAYFESLAIYLRLAKVCQGAFGSLVSGVRTNLGVLLSTHGRYDEGRRLILEAIRFYRGHASKAGMDSREELARCLFNLGRLDLEQKRPADARVAYLECAELWRVLTREVSRHFGPEHADTLTQLAMIARGEARLEEALSLLTEALRIYQESIPVAPARVLRMIERIEPAVRLLREMLDTRLERAE